MCNLICYHAEDVGSALPLVDSGWGSIVSTTNGSQCRGGSSSKVKAGAGRFQQHLLVKFHNGFAVVREMRYTSQHCWDKRMDDKMALFRECFFPNCTKLWWKTCFLRFPEVRSLQSPPPGSVPVPTCRWLLSTVESRLEFVKWRCTVMWQHDHVFMIIYFIATWLYIHVLHIFMCLHVLHTCIYRVFHNCWKKAAASKTFIDDLIQFSLSRLS